MTTEPEKRDLIVIRVFDAPVKQVWKAWSDPEQVMRWWGPDGFTCPVAQMDFREGGTSLVCMRAPQEFGGQDMYNTWTYEEIEPMKRIVYITRFADYEEVPPDINPEELSVSIPQSAYTGRTALCPTPHPAV